MSRYRLSAREEKLDVERLPDGPFPLRAHGFLAFDPKEYPNSEIILGVQNGKVLIWIAPIKTPALTSERKA